MRSLFRLFIFPAAISAAVFSSSLLADDAKVPSKEDLTAAVRLQVFLDRAEFAPGKIDGRYGEFTLKALALYRQSRGEKVSPPSEKKSASADSAKVHASDVSGLELSSVDPVFTTYTVTEDDLKSVGEVADSVPARAKQKSLPYQSTAEAIAEKFHTDVDFLAELNPGKTKSIKVGDQLSVPNVEPFQLTEVKDIKPGSEIAANDVDEPETPAETDAKKKSDKKSKPSEANPAGMWVDVDTETNMLTVHEGAKLLAAYPVTIGSERTESPVGQWKVRGVAPMPNFRYDKAMLNRGERSSEFHVLPPGPNNPVGVMWIQLNKKGIGLHGTSDPDQIGRSASHGCVRLANWDIVRLAGKIKAGVPVSIR